jgi:spectrin beta
VSDVFLDLFCSLVESSKGRRARLEDARNFFQFLQDHEEEESWLVEKQRICKAGISAKDLRAVLSLQQKHKVSLCAVCCRATQPRAVGASGIVMADHERSRS